MPELPEVETVRRVLTPALVGRTICRVIIRRDVIAHPNAAQFAAAVPNRSIRALARRGKFLSLLLHDGSEIVLHLRMTGALLVTPADFPLASHTHVIFPLDNGTEIRFIDPRRFGRFWLLEAGEADSVTGRQKLGPEPFDPALTAASLCARNAARRISVKELLLDQHVIAGIGNIYSDEILFAAHIHPARRLNTLTLPEWEALTRAIPETLTWATEKNSISADDYLAGQGWNYRNTPFLHIYGHAGQPCPRCQTPLEQMRIGSRSSCYCPCCQK